MTFAASSRISAGRRPPWRWLAAILVAILIFPALLWLPWQAQRIESSERQEQLIADTLWVEQTIRFQLGRDEESIQLVGSEIGSGQVTPTRFRDRLVPLLRNSRELSRVDWFDSSDKLVATTGDTAAAMVGSAELLKHWIRDENDRKRPHYSDPANGDLLLYHAPIFSNGVYAGHLVAHYSAIAMLEEMVPWWFAQDNDISLVNNDDVPLARRIAGGVGRGVYTHRRPLDLQGVNLSLNTNSIKAAPRLLPNLLVGSVVLLSLGLLWSLWALWRDINRRIAAEQALRQQVAFRTAMENSLQTGMRARDLEGRVTYVNPAFCQMVGLPPEQLVGMVPPMPYWAPEAMEDYQQRFSQVLSGKVSPQHETIFQRANGERFPVLIFESPLVDETGKQTGWMGSLLDISARRRAEDLNRQQQEILQSSARLATMGEMASALAHELNQPLAAISSYATGALNLLNTQGREADPAQLRQALEKASAQAQRAGQIIRSVHTFVKKREARREPVDLAALVDTITPLIDLQARPFYVSRKISVQPQLPKVLADRVLLEQVILNLTRNAVEAMRQTAPERRVVQLRIESEAPGQAAGKIVVTVTDHGHGIPPEVAERLFSPFFSTKAEGMGMGLNICRTAVEFHGGELTYYANPDGGTVFRFTLPAMEKL